MTDHLPDTIADTPADHLIRAHCYLNLPEPSLAFDRRDKLVACNRAAADLHGINPSDAPGLDLFLFFPPEASGDLARAVAACLADGGWQGELPILAAGYEVRTANVRMATVGDLVAVVYADVTDRGQSARTAHEAIRWAAMQEFALAALDDLPAPLPIWAEQVRRFAVGAAWAVESAIDRGAGRTVLVTGFGPVLTRVLEAFLERCEYLVVSADHPAEAIALTDRHRDRVRAAVLGPAATAVSVAQLHRVRPLLPVVAVGWEHRAATNLPCPVEPADLIRAVAEAVASDHENDVHVGESAEQPNFIRS
jgi:hypothetical protein